MPDTNESVENTETVESTEIIEAEGPDVETRQGRDTEAAKADLADQVRSVRAAEEGKRDAPE
ncbi:hypothetical protein QMG83_12380 [Salinibacterium sp. G-O1]|uniref:hypothetical protein n=1 Tax=Salinibacterium sp. G-O1 TaxID=3046208 RepID=UPI0024B94A36|nr:hypothetical protein [Salinibacterium sp. G-O1]MDJ0336023.1 hypothetical protein [Salinibacterium sp. G-O1]